MTDQDAKRQQIAVEKVKEANAEKQRAFDRGMAPVKIMADAVGKAAGAKLGNQPTKEAQKKVSHRKGVKRRDGTFEETEVSVLNHPSWYNQFEGSKFAATENFEVSSNLDLSTDGVTLSASSAIQVITWVPALPDADGRTDIYPVGLSPIYLEMIRLQEEVRKANSGARNYEPSDIMLVMLQTAEALAHYFELRRIYGLINIHTVWNNKLKDALIATLTEDNARNVREKRFDIWQTLHTIEVAFSNVALPAISLFDRWAMLSGTVFLDEPLKRAKPIVFKREAFGTLYAANLLDTKLPRHIHFQAAQAGIDALITSALHATQVLHESSDFVTIMGDVAKAFGKTTILPYTAEDYAVEPVYEPTVLEQIDNTTLVGRTLFGIQAGYPTATDVYMPSMIDIWDANGRPAQGIPNQVAPGQDVTNILSMHRPAFYNSRGISYENELPNMVDSPVDTPTSDQLMVLTRNMAVRQPVLGGEVVGYSIGEDETWHECRTFQYRTDVRIQNDADQFNWYPKGPSLVTLITTTAPGERQYIRPKAAGTEYFCTSYIIRVTVQYNGSMYYPAITALTNDAFTDTSTIWRGLAFVHKPVVITDVTAAYVSYNGAKNNAILIGSKFLGRMHHFALLSEYGIRSGGGGGNKRS